MIAVDTNVLVRVLVDDRQAPAQCRKARAAVAQAGGAYVSQVVQAETAWVLARAYGLAKTDIVTVLAGLATNAAVELEQADLFAAAIEAYTKGSADFADYLVLAASRSHRVELLSFDRKLAREPGVLRP